jgi:hypothetical protein
MPMARARTFSVGLRSTVPSAVTTSGQSEGAAE